MLPGGAYGIQNNWSEMDLAAVSLQKYQTKLSKTHRRQWRPEKNMNGTVSR